MNANGAVRGPAGPNDGSASDSEGHRCTTTERPLILLGHAARRNIDMMVALQQVHSSPEIKRALYQVAYARQKVAYTGPADLIHLESFVRQMSEPAGSGFHLLPLYDLFCLELLNEQGDLIWPGCCEQLAFVHEHLSTYTPSQRKILSNTILAALASIGCGLKRSDGSILAISLVQDVVNVPQLHKLITHASSSVEAREYEDIIQMHVTAGRDEAKQARIASYNESLGLRVLHWVLLIAMHDPNAATYISNAGISPAAIDRYRPCSIYGTRNYRQIWHTRLSIGGLPVVAHARLKQRRNARGSAHSPATRST
jgi:hypothetical protein